MNSAQPISYLMINKDFEKPISFSPTLARVFGIEAAIFLQWLHYFMVVKSLQERPLHDGRMWVYNSYEDWHSHMNFLSLTGMTTAIRKMETLGVILSAQLGANKFDRRKSYTIDYVRLAELTHIPMSAIFTQNGTPQNEKSDAAPVVKAAPEIAQAAVIAEPAAPPKVIEPMVAVAVASVAVPETAHAAISIAPVESVAPVPAVQSEPVKAETTEKPMTAERRVLVQRNRRLKSLDEATPEDFERLGLPDLRHIEGGLRPFSYSPVVLGICPVPSDYYAHVEEVCRKLNVPYVRPDIEPYESVPCYTDSTPDLTKTHSTLSDSSSTGSTNFSADATAPSPAAAPAPNAPPAEQVADATEKGFQASAEDLKDADLENAPSEPKAETKPATLDSIVNALCKVCYPGGDVSVQRKTAKIEQELSRAAQDILNQMPDVQPSMFRLWPAFQQVMGWRYLTPGFVVQHWAEYQTYFENPSRFVVRLPNRLKKPDPFTHLRDEFVLDIPED